MHYICTKLIKRIHFFTINKNKLRICNIYKSIVAQEFPQCGNKVYLKS